MPSTTPEPQGVAHGAERVERRYKNFMWVFGEGGEKNKLE